MQKTAYGLRIILQTDYQTAIERATAVLKTEGFGVLATIEVWWLTCELGRSQS